MDSGKLPFAVAAMGRFSSIDLVLATVWGSSAPYIYMGNGTQGFFKTIEYMYEGVIIISIEVVRREIARALRPITFQS